MVLVFISSHLADNLARILFTVVVRQSIFKYHFGHCMPGFPLMGRLLNVVFERLVSLAWAGLMLIVYSCFGLEWGLASLQPP
jgi:hypothetical protein